MEKTLGIDLGTNSIGLTIRDENDFSWFGVYTFRKGVGDGKSGEFSLAAERTKHRSSRRLYNARRYRKWETLRVLIENGYCPLTFQELNKWKNYEKGNGRVFPIHNQKFNQWIKLDFDFDGAPDYSSPYQLRRELIEKELDLDEDITRLKIGRALYHIAQRTGFKSSRKVGANEKTAVYKGSNETGTIGRNEYEQLLEKHGSLGAAFAHLEDEDIRIRNRYTLRSDYHKEVEAILENQKLHRTDFSKNIINAIFFQRPLRSQKGLVGKCTMEPNKPRCPISHPLFEEYRAWSFVNNIKYRVSGDDEFKSLPLELKKDIITEKLFLKKPNTEFSQLRKFICKDERKHWELNFSHRMDKVSVSTCPVSTFLANAFGDNWKDIKLETERVRKNKKGDESKITLDIFDIWHIVFSFEDEEYFEEYLRKELDLNENSVSELKKLWNAFPVGYANLSLKAIKNILPFLKQGIIYSEAVFLAKIPEIIGSELYKDNDVEIIDAVEKEIENSRFEKTIVNITNNLIADYKAQEIDERHARKDFTYILTEYDKKDVERIIERSYTKKLWDEKPQEEKDLIFSSVVSEYQKFFNDRKREYRKQPKLIDRIKEFLINEFKIEEKELAKLYHPSMIDIYPSSEEQVFLNTPKTRAFKNPMAYKTLYKLRHVINHLIEKGLIDSDTKIVLEVARELNDKNRRAAIEDYQRVREKENLEYAIAISELIKDRDFTGYANPNNQVDREKFRLWTEQTNMDDDKLREIYATKDDVKKYRLWKEQNAVCMYTGKIIKLTDLFDKNIIDFEHTIPRSKSFDNSLANLTVCFANYNRDIKKNRIPTELPNYQEDSAGYQAIEPRLEKWQKKIESLAQQMDSQVIKSKTAIDKETKDNAIRRRHFLKMELDYWINKVDRFTREDVPLGFKNSQLVDTQLISKYAFHYLKTVFNQVDVVKGTITSEFRKIYGIQAKDEEKDRGKHSHHAVDAAVLTLLPSSAKRKDILQKKYEFEETHPNKQYHELPFEGFNYAIIQKIEKEILINNLVDQERTLAPAKKFVRKRGRIEYLKDKNGIILRDELGNKIPKVSQGDSVRGELHMQTYYGKIKVAAKDQNGSLLRDEEGDVIYNQVDGKDEIWMVIRKPIENVNFDSDVIIDSHLAEHLKKQLQNGTAINDLKDFQGKKLRRLRCRVKAARGFMNPDNVTIVKEQVYKSNKVYKNFIYADSGENYMFGLYQNENGKSIVPLNVFESSKYAKFIENPEPADLFRAKEQTEPVLIGRGKKSKPAELIHVFMIGQKVLFYENDKEELKELDKEDLSKRLYFVKRLADANAQRILFQHHLEARDDKQLALDFPKEVFGTKGKDGFSKFPVEFVAPRLLLTPGNFNFIIENIDFVMELDGKIEFKF